MDTIENLSVTECGHRYCTECIADVVNSTPQQQTSFECPICRHKCSKAQICKVQTFKQAQEQESENKGKEELDDDEEDSKPVAANYEQSASKMRVLIEMLTKLHTEDNTNKCVIFSQWTVYLDLIGTELTNQGFKFVRLDGTMTMQKRQKSIDLFSNKNDSNPDNETFIFLVSLKAGGVGINLTAANHVFMMDVWWNPAVEDQAFDRLHRIGQKRTVYIHRLIIKDSIEQKILAMQEEKRNVATNALDNKTGTQIQSRSNNINVDDLYNLFAGDISRN
jgi:SNF2 family DNA or RNA helicase